MGKTKPKADELAPIPWDKIHPHYKAGVRSLRAIGEEFGTSHVNIKKHAAKHGWGERDLKPAILERSDALVARAAVTNPPVTGPVTTKPGFQPPTPSDAQTIEVNAQALAVIRLGHRESIGKARKVCQSLMAELEVVVDAPELFGMVYDALSNPDEPAVEALRNLAALVGNLPARTKVLKDLADAMARLIGMEREAFGLNTLDGTDRPMVIIKDFTGRGDPDNLKRS